jgi:hypothetical protein
MQEDKVQKPEDPAKEDATSSETLTEIEETEKVSEKDSDAGTSSIPSPDGSFDSVPNERGPKDDPGPM